MARTTRLGAAAIVGALCALTMTADAQRTPRGILHAEAPDWNVKTWINLPEDSETVDVEDYQGKVIYLYCFQTW